MTFDLRAINMANSSGWSTKCCFLHILVVFAIFGVDNTAKADPRIEGFRVETEDVSRFKDGRVCVLVDHDISLRFFGEDLTAGTAVRFTPSNATEGSPCDVLGGTQAFYLQDTGQTGTTATVTVNLGHTLIKHDKTPTFLTFCTKPSVSANDTDQSLPWTHQGSSLWRQIGIELKPVKTTMLPIWLQIMVVILLLCFSGLFSGLNLGLMSLDQTELKIVESVGTDRERTYAKRIRPVRKRGNYLLCTILLGNVLVNNTLAILMDDLTGSGLSAVVAATFGIVIFGEIIPQAVCSRYGLAIGANTLWFTMFFMVVTFPLSFPISKILDLILGEEIGAVYNRDRLRELLRVTQGNMDLKNDEVNIITGALDLSKKTVKDVMTRLQDVYMIDYDAILDFETMSEIMKTGYTRIPVYEKDNTKIIAILNIKDLAFIDPDDRTPLKTVAKFYNHPVNFVFEDCKLDVMLEEFKKGRSHVAFVQCVNNEGPGDPFYETLGLVTLEDVIEEIIQSEIVDETDTITDNRRKVRRMDNHQVKDFSIFNKPDEQNYPRLSPQLALATFQYLSTSVSPFREELISHHVLQRLIKQNVVVSLKVTDPLASSAIIYHRGKTCDYFVLILQGRIQVDVGKENMVFEGGPFMYFGAQALTGVDNSLSKNQFTSVNSISSASDSVYAKTITYTPDFSVRALTDVQYMKLHRPHYVAARRATVMERQPKTPDALDSQEDQFAKEWHRATRSSLTTPPTTNSSLYVTSPISLSHPSISPEQHIKLDLDTSQEDSKDSVSLNAPPAPEELRNRSVTQDSAELDGHVANAGTPLISCSEEEPKKKQEEEC